MSINNDIEDAIELALNTKPSLIQITVKEPERKLLSSVTYYPIEILIQGQSKFIVQKRYSEFEALYQVLEMKYNNFKFPELPSKLQVFHKNTTRQKSFQDVINAILKYAELYEEKRQEFIQSIFVFLLSETKKGKRVMKSSISSMNTEINEAYVFSPTSQPDQSPSYDQFADLPLNSQTTPLPFSPDSNIEEKKSNDGSFNDNNSNKAITPSSSILSVEEPIKQMDFEDYQMSRREAVWQNNDTDTKSKVDKTNIQHSTSLESSAQVRIRKSSEEYPKTSLFQSAQFPKKKEESINIEKKEEVESEDEKITNFNFKMKIKFYYKDDFETYFVKFKGHDMLLFSRIHIMKSKQFPNTIEMRHEQDFQPIQIKTNTEKKMESLISQIEEYNKSTKFDSSNSFNSIGKLVFFVNRCNSIKIPNGEPVLLKIKTDHFTFESSVHIHTKEGIFFRQEFSVPISNPYETINFEFYRLFNDSWLRTKVKEQFIGKARFFFADILSNTAGFTIQNMILDIDLPDNVKIPLKINVRNDSSRLAILAPNPQGYEEGDKKHSSIDLFLVSFYRFRRVIGAIAQVFQTAEDIYYFKYPKLSYLFFSLLFLYIALSQPQNIFTHIVLVIALSCLSYQPNIRQFLINFFNSYILDQKNEYSNTPTFLTADEDMYQQMRCSFEKINVNSLQVEDNDGESASLLQKYYNLKKKFVQIHGYITFICNFCEKAKNLFTWEDPQRSTYLICFFFLCCIIIHALPIRIFLLLILVFICEDGRKMIKVRRNFNKEIALNVCEYTLRKNLQLPKDKIIFTDPWPKNEKILKLITEDFYQHLQIHLFENSLIFYKTPLELAEELSKCETTLTLYAGDKIQESDLLFEQIRKQIYPKRTLVENIYFYVFNFIYNIPSDYYRLVHPNKIKEFYQKHSIKKPTQAPSEPPKNSEDKATK